MAFSIQCENTEGDGKHTLVLSGSPSFRTQKVGGFLRDMASIKNSVLSFVQDEYHSTLKHPRMLINLLSGVK